MGLGCRIARRGIVRKGNGSGIEMECAERCGKQSLIPEEIEERHRDGSKIAVRHMGGGPDLLTSIRGKLTSIEC
jgi:hypothetical protein